MHSSPSGYGKRSAFTKRGRERDVDAYFAARPELQPVRALVEARASLGRCPVTAARGDRQFVARQDYASRPPVVMVREPGAAERVIVDVTTFPIPAPWLDWWYPSPDGRLVAFGASAHASERSILHIWDVDSDRLLDERIADASFCVVAWLADSTGFYYNRSLGSDLERPQKAIFFHRVGEPARAEPEAAVTRPGEEYVYPLISEDSRWLAAVSGDVDPCPDAIRDLWSNDAWRPFLYGIPATFAGGFHDECYICVTTDGAEQGRVVAIPLATPTDRSTWRELVPEGDGVMRQVSASDDRLLVVDLVDTSARVRLFAADGTLLDTVPIDAPSSLLATATSGHMMMDPLVSFERDEVRFVSSAFATPPSIHVYDAEARTLSIDRAHPLPIAPAAELVVLHADDGRAISYWLVRPDTNPVPRPALMYGYGGWNLAFGLPGYLGGLLAFVELGGAVVLPHLRGDGTYGESFWHEARLARKQQTFDDAILIARHLVDSGVARGDGLAVAGASNGGLLAAAMVTQAPDLFRAVVPLVPLTDMLEYVRDAYPGEFRSEYGDPGDAPMAAVLEAYSPLHRIVEGVEYPSVMVVTGDHDLRCPPWHGERFVAALAAAGGSDRPILLKVQPDAGHTNAPAVSVPEWISFVAAEVGLSHLETGRAPE